MVKHLQKLSALVLAGLCLFGSNPAQGQVTENNYPYIQRFDDCTAGNNIASGDWTQVSITGDAIWGCTSYGLNSTGAVEMNGYDSNTRGSLPNEDWLISPALDLSSLPKPQLSFWSTSRYEGPALKLMVSTTYNGDDTIDPAEWTALDAGFPAVDSDVWAQAQVLLSDYQEEPNIYLAFVYTSGSGAGAASRWIVDDVAVTDVSRLLTTGNVDLAFGDVSVGAVSASEAFTFKAEGYAQEVQLTAPEGFELSKDGVSFSRSLSYTAAAAAEDNTVYARFKPTTEAVRVAGPVTFTSGSELNEQRGMLQGSSILRENTLDIATWNMEWFGSTGNGPSDETLQYENAKKVIAGLKADIIGVQEVSDDATLRALADELGYEVENMAMPWQSYDDYQQVYFLYDPEVVTVKKEKVLLSKLYEDIRAGRTSLPDYPSSSSSFWASGRLPYLVQFEATINGVKQTVNVVNIHAKANSGEDIKQYNRRKYDVQVLKDSLDAYYGNTNLVLLGDYNDDVDVSVVGTGNPSTYEPFVESKAYNALTYDLSVADAFSYESGSLRSFLDHIIISEPLQDNYIDMSVQVESQFVSSISDYRNTTSDHVPVTARFRLQSTPTVTFSNATATKAEDAGTFAITLSLSDAMESEQTLAIEVVSGATTATAEDYSIAGMADGIARVTIPAGETTATFTVTILDDAVTEPTEEVVLRISSTDPALEVGDQPTYRLVIEDNDNTTGIADATTGQFQVYPNPAGSFVRLLLPERVGKLQHISLTLYTVDGKRSFEANGVQEAVQQVLNRKVKQLKNGMYLLKVVAGKEVFLTRLVKQ